MRELEIPHPLSMIHDFQIAHHDKTISTMLPGTANWVILISLSPILIPLIFSLQRIAILINSAHMMKM